MLTESIQQIGTELVQCTQTCAGVARNQAEGIIPRCLVLENPDATGKGCLVSGINPGRSGEKERATYRTSGSSYEVFLKYWDVKIKDVPYYQHLRKLIKGLKLTGPVIWSDLAKCENAPSVKGLIPLQTLRSCSGRFLHRELKATPSDWPILGVGAEAYKALAYLEPNRTVIGVPHPTGSRGQYFALFDEHGGLLPHVRAVADSALASPTPVALWLSAKAQ